MSQNSSEWWPAVSSYLDQVLDLPEAERPAWLRGVSERDSELASRIEMLLKDHGALARAGFLDHGPDALASRDTSAGAVIGSYRLLAPIGEGGMGTVWLGERCDGEIQRKVAIKLLAAGWYRPGWRERFLRERQLLASLHHASIVQLLDAGHMPDGRPYLVMEYVDGDPIDVYADRVGINERLRLFLRVCEAVSHAHQRLIIHRDLKPSNILVDRDGQPKLLDFGIAKLLDDGANTTQTVERMMTPHYASPEQLRGTPQATATDIYSLGAVLYKLLTGRPPREDPSTNAGASVARQDASRLNPNVAVDADYVLRKALRDEPEERYRTVDAFAGDVRAVLESRPVDARSGDSWYRARKVLRRNRVSVAAAVLVILSLSAGVYVANRQRQIAEGRFQQVRQLANRFIALDADIRDLPGSTKVRSEIVSESLGYLTSLGRDARGDTELAMEIGDAYLQVARVQGVPYAPSLGLFTEAEGSLRQADVFVDSVLAAEPQHRKALLVSAQIAHDRMALVDNQDRRDDALAQARRASERLDRLLSMYLPTPEEIDAATQIYSNLAVANQNSNRFDDAIRYSRRALDVSAGVDAARRRRAQAFGVLSYSLRRVGKLDEALTTSQQSRQLLDGLMAAGAADWFHLTNALWREGLVLHDADGPSLNRPEDAVRVFQRAVDLAEEWAARDPDDYRSRNRIAVVGRDLGDSMLRVNPGRALAVYDHALGRIRQASANARGQREQAHLLLSSSYALRALRREADAKQRIDAGFALLRETKQYPTESVEPFSEPDHALRALADHYVAIGEVGGAVALYEELLQKTLKWDPKLESDLRDAAAMDETWEALANLLPQVDRAAEAKAYHGRRAALWADWLRRLPDNPFARQRMERVPRP